MARSEQMSRPVKTVDCDQHGKQEETYVCEHLVYGEGLGFFQDDGEENPRPDAWCSNCERIRQAHGGWTEQAEKQLRVKLLCGACYDRARQRNQRMS
jgi:hypothetical protein